MSRKTLRASQMAVGLLLSLLLAFLHPGVARADGIETTLITRFDAVDNGEVRIAGQLVDSSGNAIPGATISAIAAGAPLGTVTTQGDGSFALTFVIPEESRRGVQEVRLAFEGDGIHAASSASHAIDYRGEGAAANGVVADDGVQQTVLTLSLSTSSAVPGETITLNGSLSTHDGKAIASGSVVVSVGGQEQAAASTLTDGDGTFSSFVELPLDLAPGAVTIGVAFPGSQALRPSNAEATITIEAPSTSASGAPAEEQTAAAPESAAAPSASASPEASPTATSTDAAAAPATATSDSGSNLGTWAILIGVVLATGTGLALIATAMRPKRTPADNGEVGLIGEPEDAELEQADAWAEGALDGDRPMDHDAGMSPLGESASAFAPPPTVRTMPPSWFRDDETVSSRPAPGHAIAPESDVESTDVRGQALPRRAAL